MRYLKILIISFAALIFAGCAGKGTPNIHMQASSPIFITNFNPNKDANASVYINFKNSSAQPNTLEQTVRAKFEKSGFVSSPDMSRADVVILGDFMMFERVVQKEPRVFMNLGYGFGSFGRRSSMGVGMVFGDPFYDDYYDRTNYFYKASVSVSIKTKEREQRTILHAQSDKNVYSPSYIMPFIEDKIATQILNFFY